MYDIAIIGAGPAGATLARMIGQHYKVLLIDKRPLADEAQQQAGTKCCGGLLAPDAQNMLGKMSLALPRHVIVAPQLFVVRTLDLHNHLERYYQRFHINIDRDKFDRWLVSLLPGSVDLRCGLLKSFERDHDLFKLHLTQDGKTYSEYAKVLIGADGASSLIRKKAFPKDKFLRSYVAIQEWFATEHVAPYFSVIFDSEITDFYSWTIPKENSLLIGSALPQHQPSQKFELLKQKLKDYNFQFGSRIKREGAFILRPTKTPHAFTQPGIALVGEAAGWISPSSAEGLSYAFKSALLAAESLLEGPEEFIQKYENRARDLQKNIQLKNLKSPFMYNTLLRKMVMASGLQSIQVLDT
ncbi:MAG: FAD-binding protein [Bacillota bacterium]|nr:FAD-binding protein [Bacillota bacterium]MDW7685307.1 FAD-binding protein [Bacillota bacterium]